MQAKPHYGSTGGRQAAVLGGLAAAFVVGASMLLLRTSLQVRSVPERLVEWLLLFVPPTLFEAILQHLGFDAKRYALYLAILVILGVFAWLGYIALRAQWSPRRLGLLGAAVWLTVMLFIMPLTSAGIFAFDLLDGKRAAIGGYLAVGLSYAAALALMRLRAFQPRANLESRRLTLGLLGGAAVSYAATYMSILLLPHQASVPSVVLEDPQEPVPSGGLEPPAPHPKTVEAATAPAPAPAQPGPTAVGRVDLPEPTMTRELVRNKDGAVIPGGRRPGHLTAPITMNQDFYIVTKNAGGDPYIHPSDWHLLVDGEVAQSFKIDYQTLRRLPAVEVIKTLECISNFVGKPELAPFGAELISTAVWKGVPVRDILGMVGGPGPAAISVVAFGADEYSSVLPLDVALDPVTLLVYEMNGEVLPREHGYPARLLVPDRYGMKNPKWLMGLRVIRRDYDDWYGQRNWSKTAVVQTMCRIDSPEPDAELPPGEHVIAGIAYAGRRGTKRVEFSLDEGRTWRSAVLSGATAGQDGWVAWRGSFDVGSGQEITVVARAIDGTGATQVEAFGLPEPDGATGWPRVSVHAP